MATTSPLASSVDFTSFGSNAELVQNDKIWTPTALTKLMTRSTAIIESRCGGRRLAPFVGLIESQYAYGLSPDEYGTAGDIPLDLAGALGMSQANVFGVSDMVRRFWLDCCAPQFAELWTYNIQSIQLLRTFGDTQMFTSSFFTILQGPENDSGHCRMQIGTYCPVGTTLRITYDGGYTLGVPDDLNLACILQATKLVLVGAEPESRMSTKQIDDELNMLLAPYARS